MLRGEEDMTPDELYSLIRQLPRHARLGGAMADDEELAEEMLDAPVAGGPQGPLVTEWTPEVEVMAAVFDRLGDLIALVASIGGPTKAPPRYPIPATAMDRVKSRREDDSLAELLDDATAAQDRWREWFLSRPIEEDVAEAQERWLLLNPLDAHPN